VVICLERGVDLHMAQLMPLALTVSCFSTIQIGFAFLVPAHPGSPGKRAVKRVCVCARALQEISVQRDAVWRTDESVKSVRSDIKRLSAQLTAVTVQHRIFPELYTQPPPPPHTHRSTQLSTVIVLYVHNAFHL